MVTITPYPSPIQQPIVKVQSFLSGVITKLNGFRFPSFKELGATFKSPHTWNWKVTTPIAITVAILIFAAYILIDRAIKANASAREKALIEEARALHREGINDQ